MADGTQPRTTGLVVGATYTGDAQSWNFQNSYVERYMDHSALSAAHPDDTLVLAGPARYEEGAQSNFMKRLLPIGMVQQMQITQQRPTTPMQAIGSGRLFFVSGKSQGTIAIARLFVNGRNLLRALYTNAVQAGINVTKFDDSAAAEDAATFFANLDSELFYIPFGMAVFFRDKIHQLVGGIYCELCMINTWAIAVGAGQNMIVENVNILFDRLRPIKTATGESYEPRGKVLESVYGANVSHPDMPGGPEKDRPSA